MTRMRHAIVYGAAAVVLFPLPRSAQQIRPYRPAFHVTDYAIAIEVPDRR